MNENVSVLHYIYQNVQMGKISINYILSKCKSKKFCNMLKMHKEEYDYISLESQNILKKYEEKVKEINLFTKLLATTSMKFNINEETSISKITRMLLRGTNMGILDITDKLNNYKISDIKVKKLAKTLKQTLENNLEELKKYI